MNNKLVNYYNFLHDPLVDIPNQFSFFAHNRKFVLDELRNFDEEKPLMVIGAEGSGKTVIKNIFIAELSGDIQVINISYNQKFNHKALNIIADKVKCNPDLPSIINQFKLLTSQNNSYCLIIDNAERLSYELIANLMQLSKIIKVYLFARESIIDNLADLKPKVIKLPECTDTQVKQYLAERLNDAGSSIEIFNEQQLSRIYLVSKGIFKNINHTARKILLENIKYSKGNYKLGKTLTLGGGFCIVLLVSWMVFNQSYFRARNQAFNSEPVEPVVSENKKLQEPNKIEDDLLVISDHQDVKNLEVLPKAEDFEEITEELEESEIITPVIAKTISNKQNIKTEQNLKPQITVSEQQDKNKLPTKVLLNNKKRIDELPKYNLNDLSKNLNSNWYKQQDSKNYCLQIVAGTSEQVIKQLAKNYGTEFNYFKKIVKGKSFYVLTYGNFGTRDQAKNQIVNLPVDIQKNKPFPVSFASIHKEMVE